MSEGPWLTIIGLGEDGPDGLSVASQDALAAAEVVMGAARHLELLPDISAKTVTWPVPFSDGMPLLESHCGKKVVVLASGDPFWFGAGSVFARNFARDEWQAVPGRSAFSLAAAQLGWPLESTLTIGLHAAPLTQLRPHLHNGHRAIVLLRNGAAVGELAASLCEFGFDKTTLTIMEALGGPRERIRETTAQDFALDDVQHPVAVALNISGDGPALPLATGRPDDFFDNDGQITKRPMRALTLSALAPKPGEHLWDIGGGSGSISIEWLLCHPTMQATVFEKQSDRASRIKTNAASLGVDRIEVITGPAPDVLDGASPPNAVFIGGGLSEGLLQDLAKRLPKGTRLVANAVTLESEALLAQWHGLRGGDLTRIELSNSAALGSKRGWRASFPVVQWSVVL